MNLTFSKLSSLLLFSFILFGNIINTLFAQSLILNKNVFGDVVFDGQVNAMAKYNDTMYVGGIFKRVGVNKVAFAVLDYQQNVLDNFPRISSPLNGNGPAVQKMVSDKSGGYFLAGNFGMVGNEKRNNIARINADGSVHPFVADGIIQDAVRSMDIFGDTLFLGLHTNNGYGGQKGAFISVDVSTALPVTGMPEVNGEVRAMEPDGNGGYFIGGVFTEVGDSLRLNLAHINSGGVVTSWNPQASDKVTGIKVNGNSVFVCGYFATIGGIARPSIAALNKQTGLVLPWNANATSQIDCMLIDGSFIFFGGTMSQVGGQTRRTLAKVALSDGAVSSWNAPYNLGSVAAICVVNSKLYVGGQFSSNFGQSYKYLTALDKNTGIETGWSPNIPVGGIRVNALLAANNVMYVGGAFTNIANANRSNIAAIDTATGLATSFNPVITFPGASPTLPGSYPVSALALQGNTLYLGGQGFQTVNGQPRPGLAAVSILTGNTTGWQPLNNGAIVYALSIANSKLLIGGSLFNRVATESIDWLIALNKNTGQKIDWASQVNGNIKNVIVSDSTLYIGGGFTSVGTELRTGLAAFTLPGLQLTSWNPILSSPFSPAGTGLADCMEVKGRTIYVAGNFNALNGTTRNYLAAIDSATGNTLSWNPAPNSAVYSIKLKDNLLYVGGNFNTIGGKTRNKIAALSLTNGQATNWFCDADAQVTDIQALGNYVYAKGDFTIIGNATRPGFAQLDAATGDATSFNPLLTNSITSCIPLQDKIFLYGSFASVNNVARIGLAAIQVSTGKILPWQNNLDIGGITTMLLDSNTLFVGGGFNSISNVAKSNLAAIDITTNQVKPWTVNLDGGVYTLAVNGSVLYIGGGFNTVNGITRKYAASINKNTGIVGNWNPAPNSAVKAIVPDGGVVYIGGLFTILGVSPNLVARSIAATNASNGSVTSWDPGSLNIDANAGRGVNALVKYGSTLYAGGSFFNHFANSTATQLNGLAAFNTTSGALTNWRPINVGVQEGSFIPQINSLVINPANKSLLVGSYRFSVLGSMPASGLAEISLASGYSISDNVFIDHLLSSSGYKPSINALLVEDGKLYAGGFFTTINSSDKFNAAAFDINTIRISLCPPTSSTTLLSNISGTNFQWQANTGNGFTNISNTANYAGSNTATLQLLNIQSSWNNYKYRCVVDGNFSSAYTLNFTTEWVGSSNSLWNNPANWSCGVLPDNNTNVIIKRGDVLVTANSSCKSIYVDKYASFTINPNIQFIITGP